MSKIGEQLQDLRVSIDNIKENMKKIKIAENETKVLNKKKSFVESVLTSLRHKINDPLGQRRAK